MIKRIGVISLVLVVVGVFCVLYLNQALGFLLGGERYDHAHTTAAVSAQFDRAAERLEHFTATLRNDPSVLKNLQDNEVLSLTTLLFTQGAEHDITSLTITDERGVVLARTNNRGVAGDYLFDTTEYGQLLSAGVTVRTIDHELDGAALSILTGMPILGANRSMIGSLVATEEIDGDFLRQYIVPVLGDDHHVLVYDQAHGIEATSFTGEAHARVQAALTGAVKNLTAEQTWLDTVSLQGETYDLYHVSFDQLYQQAGNGGLVFFIKQPTGSLLVQTVVILTLLLLTVALIYAFTGWHQKLTTKETLLLLLLTALISGGTSLTITYLESITPSQSLDDSAYPIYNSTIHLRPASGLFDKNFDQNVSIVIESGGEPINAARAEVAFDPTAVRVEDIVIIDSFCEPGFVIERMIDHEAGSAVVSCGTRLPFTGDEATLATLIVQPLIADGVQLQFTNRTAVYAHDGLGTNVLRKKGNAHYQIVDSQLDDRLLLFSRTHPNSTRWYSEPGVVLSWRGPAFASYRYTLAETRLETMPAQAALTTESEVLVTPPRDGEYYFHLQPVGTTDIYYFKINSDQTVPSAPNLRVSESVVRAGQLIRLEFESQDMTSGVEEPYYYVSFNGGTFFPVTSPFYTSLPTVGEHTITLRVFDNAGNYNDTKKTIQVKSDFTNPAALLLSVFRPL